MAKWFKIDYKIIKHSHHSSQTVNYRQNKIENVSKIINILYKNATVYLNRKYKLYEFFKNGSRSVQE